MSFGYSVGDFIAVVQLAYKVYDSCKSSVDEYKDIGRDVGNTHLVLSAVQRYWKAEESHGRNLIVAQLEDLKQLSGNSYEILEKIQEVLDKHRSLGYGGRVRDKLKWSLASFVSDIGPQRQSLQENTHALAIFNATLTAENASGVANQQNKVLEEHSQLLKFLVTRYFEYQTGIGNRVAPAFSQVAVKNIEQDEDDSWQNIDLELEAAGFSSTTVKGNRAFIREWITTVIPDDDNKDTDLTAGSTIVEDDDSPPVGGIEDLTVSNTQKDVEVERKEPDGNKPPSRVASASSRRSQSSAWCELNTKNADYVIHMIAKVLKSKYGEDCDGLYKLPIKRAFHYLDWTDRGWISIAEVQRYCHQAAEIAKFSVDELDFGQLGRKMDVNNDNQVSLDELIEIVVTLRQLILESIIMVNANFGGRIEAGIQLKTFFDTSVDESMLPFQWHNWHQSLSSSREYRHVLLHTVLGSKQSIAPLQINFSNAAFVATGHCASQTADALNKWRAALISMPKEQTAEYTNALNNVLRATAKFHIFNARYLPTKLHLFDYCSERINIIPPEQLQDLADCPAADLADLRRKCWEVLDPILGFVYDLKLDGLKQAFLNAPSIGLVELNSTPLAMSEWRRLRMLERSRRIVHDLQRWEEMEITLLKCQKWCLTHSTHLDTKAELAIETAKSLYHIQQEAYQRESIHKIKIVDVDVKSLKHEHFCRNPSTFFGIIIDGIHFGRTRPVKSTRPSWYHNNDYEVSKESNVQLKFYNGRAYEKVSRTGVSKSLIGCFEFKVSDITNFNGKSTVTKRGPLNLPDYSTLKASTPEISVNVYTNWKFEKTDWDSTPTYDLANEISLYPLPLGWEARQTKDNDIYFINLENWQSTACLWRAMVPNNDTLAKLAPLPKGWTVLEVNGKVVYQNHKAETMETPPEPDDKSTFQNIIRSKEYCQLVQFFPKYLIDQFKEEAKLFLRIQERDFEDVDYGWQRFYSM